MALRNFGLLEASTQLANANAAVVTEGANLSMFGCAVDRMTSMYDHVAQFGIDKTFLRLYNSHNELDRAIGMQFPSCEDMDVMGSPYDRTSTAFMVAMEDEGEGIWAKIKAIFVKIWNWIKEKVSAVYNWIKKLFGSTEAKVNQVEKQIQEAGPEAVVEVPVEEVAKEPGFLKSMGIKFVNFWKNQWQETVNDKNKLVAYMKNSSEARRAYKEAVATMKKLTALNASEDTYQKDLDELDKKIAAIEKILADQQGKPGAGFRDLKSAKQSLSNISGYKKNNGKDIYDIIKNINGIRTSKNGWLSIDQNAIRKYLSDLKKSANENKRILDNLETYKNDYLKTSKEASAIIEALSSFDKDKKYLSKVESDQVKGITSEMKRNILSRANRLAMLEKALVECDAKLGSALAGPERAKVLEKIRVYGKKAYAKAAKQTLWDKTKRVANYELW